MPKDPPLKRLLDHRASAMRIVDLNHDGQRTEFVLPTGQRIGVTFRKRKRGGWRVECDEYPAGMRIQTNGGT